MNGEADRLFFLVYFNGTPAATAAFALDVIVPMHFGKPANETIDLVVSGPNEGNNNGPFLYTLSGTIGAAYLSVERGVSTFGGAIVSLSTRDRNSVG